MMPKTRLRSQNRFKDVLARAGPIAQVGGREPVVVKSKSEVSSVPVITPGSCSQLPCLLPEPAATRRVRPPRVLQTPQQANILLKRPRTSHSRPHDRFKRASSRRRERVHRGLARSSTLSGHCLGVTQLPRLGEIYRCSSTPAPNTTALSASIFTPSLDTFYTLRSYQLHRSSRVSVSRPSRVGVVQLPAYNTPTKLCETAQSEHFRMPRRPRAQRNSARPGTDLATTFPGCLLVDGIAVIRWIHCSGGRMCMPSSTTIRSLAQCSKTFPPDPSFLYLHSGRSCPFANAYLGPVYPRADACGAKRPPSQDEHREWPSSARFTAPEVLCALAHDDYSIIATCISYAGSPGGGNLYAYDESGSIVGRSKQSFYDAIAVLPIFTYHPTLFTLAHPRYRPLNLPPAFSFVASTSISSVFTSTNGLCTIPPSLLLVLHFLLFSLPMARGEGRIDRAVFRCGDGNEARTPRAFGVALPMPANLFGTVVCLRGDYAHHLPGADEAIFELEFHPAPGCLQPPSHSAPRRLPQLPYIAFSPPRAFKPTTYIISCILPPPPSPSYDGSLCRHIRVT
uniref:Uncharacterized protein n=1 Tax=Mycena chlorophos TaxID=658473 RepID=A0ABQ0KVS6_MYCCL|nr:predicted protein [Mycena chlorophos]